MGSPLVFDDNDLRKLPEDERLIRCEKIVKYEKDESVRWDAVWLAGEIAVIACLDNDKKYLFDKISDLMAWVLKNDKNGVVKHEACYQIAARDMRKNIPDLVNAALHDTSILTRHEALESLGLMRATEAMDLIKNALTDSSVDVRETAHFVVKRLKRMERLNGKYNPSHIV
jgi:HEAT repeat protein